MCRPMHRIRAMRPNQPSRELPREEPLSWERGRPARTGRRPAVDGSTEAAPWTAHRAPAVDGSTEATLWTVHRTPAVDGSTESPPRTARRAPAMVRAGKVPALPGNLTGNLLCSDPRLACPGRKPTTVHVNRPSSTSATPLRVVPRHTRGHPRDHARVPIRRGAFRSVLRDAFGAALRAFARDTRAAAGLELGFGAFVLISVAALSFDLYTRVEADTVGAQLAATMADYVSRGPAPGETTLDGDALKDLGTFLHEHVLGVPADLVFIVSALRQPAGNNSKPAVLWSDATNLRFGDGVDDPDTPLDCTSRSSRRTPTTATVNVATLPSGITTADFTMAANEVLVVAEVCMRLVREGAPSSFVIGPVYRYHALPARTPGQFPDDEPEYAQRGAPALAGRDNARPPGGEDMTMGLTTLRDGVSCALRRFARDTRAAAGIAAALLTLGTVAGAALHRRSRLALRPARRAQDRCGSRLRRRPPTSSARIPTPATPTSRPSPSATSWSTSRTSRASGSRKRRTLSRSISST